MADSDISRMSDGATSAASRPAVPADRSRPPKPATAPKPKPFSGEDDPFGDPFGGGNPFTSRVDSVKAYDPKIPPRPPGPEADNVSTAFADARQEWDAVFGEQNHRLMEMRIAVLQGMEMAVSRLEDVARRTRALMERNDALAREAEREVVEGRSLERQQDELESQVQELTERTLALAQRATTLREERTQLETSRGELETTIESDRTAVAELKNEVTRLEGQVEALQHEKGTLDQKKSQVEERLARLQRLRDEFLSETTRAERALNELTSLPVATTSARAKAQAQSITVPEFYSTMVRLVSQQPCKVLIPGWGNVEVELTSAQAKLFQGYSPNDWLTCQVNLGEKEAAGLKFRELQLDEEEPTPLNEFLQLYSAPPTSS